MFLRDLTFIEDGNQTWDEGHTSINVAKLVMIGIGPFFFADLSLGKIVARVHEIQRTPFKLFKVPIILQYLRKYPVLELEEREERFPLLETSDGS